MSLPASLDLLTEFAFRAAAQGDARTLSASLAQGARVDLRDRSGQSLLDLACRSDSPHSAECVIALLRAGASPESEGDSYPGPLFLACAEEAGGAEKIKALCEAGWDPLETLDDASPFHWLCQFDGTAPAALALAEAGADLHALNNEGQSALDMAFVESSMDLILALISLGARLNSAQTRASVAARKQPELEGLWSSLWDQRELSLSLGSEAPSEAAAPRRAL